MGRRWRWARAIALFGATACAADSTLADAGTDDAGTSSTGSPTTSSSGSSGAATTTTGSETVGSTTTVSDDSTGSVPRDLDLNFVFVHGIKTCEDAKIDARESLSDLSAALEEAMPQRVAAFEAEHPGTHVEVGFAAVNIYLATPSPDIPAGAAPSQLDQWDVGYGDCGSQRAGDPCTTAYEWRYRLRQEIEELLPGADNLVLVGHSTGARAAIDLAADVGPDGIGTGNWGMGDRVLGAVSIHGMVDSLANYDLVAPLPFEDVCKTGGDLLDVFGTCDPGDGWCEYATRLSGSESVRWLAEHKAVLTLTSVNDCGAAFFLGEGDGSLPARAQSAPFAPGLELTPVEGRTWGPTHGDRYGGFCHSAIDTETTQGHMLAVEMARDRILDWLFVSAPFVVAEGTVETESSVAQGLSSEPMDVGATPCPADIESYDAQVHGVRLHPGLIDGDDTPIDDDEITVELTENCQARVVWTQSASEGNHAGRFHWKIAARTGSGVLGRALSD